MENYSIPLILKCTITGREVKYYSRSYIEKRIARVGDLNTLINTFMIKGAKKKDKNTQTYKPTRTWKGVDLTQPTNKLEEKNVSPPVIITNVYKYADGGQCTVTTHK